MTTTTYNAEHIEVLDGLEPVQRRPGMYTDTTRPNHLLQEVIDNSVDEALAGHAKYIEVVIHDDGSLEVSDDGRGMPVDMHPQLQISGVEVILTRLHAGGKFSQQNYKYSGGLHGVGVSGVPMFSGTIWSSYDAVHRDVGGNCETSATYDGFLVKANTGNVYGTIAIYGLAKS